jgi:hypothetical protein
VFCHQASPPQKERNREREGDTLGLALTGYSDKGGFILISISNLKCVTAWGEAQLTGPGRVLFV